MATATYTPPRVLTDSDLNLARRFSFGVDSVLVDQVYAAGGGAQWFAQQLSPSGITDTAADATLAWFPRLTDSYATTWNYIKLGVHTRWDYSQDMVGYTLARRLLSKRHVHEVMSDFWSNLLFVNAYDDKTIPWRYDYDKVIRANALGSFTTMLQQAIVHPAMSGWLTNYDNTKDGINENLGRELLELHTVGRTAGYTEDDVQSSARILTGFTVDVYGTFKSSYTPANHYTGQISVLGFTDANADADGRAAVNRYLAYLATHPATAQRIAERLCTRFVSDTPSDAIVAAVKAAYLSSNTDIPTTLKALVAHPDFAASAGAKISSPVYDLLHTTKVCLVSPAKPTKDDAYLWHLVAMTLGMGERPFSWPRPDGYPEDSRVWSSPARMLTSWQLHYGIPANTAQSSQVTISGTTASLPTVWPRTLGEVVDHLSRLLVGQPADDAMTTAACAIVGYPKTQVITQALQITIDQLNKMRGTILNSPRAMVR